MVINLIVQSRPTVTPAMIQAAVNVLNSGVFVKGKYVETFENAFANYIGVKYGIAVNSGTSAILVALKAIGIGKGDEVIVPSHTFVASATPILMCDATPVFVDVKDDYLIDTNDVENKITANTKAIICVHLYGQPCDMDALIRIANRHRLHLIEDCAQAHGATYRIDGKAGALGIAGCFSFFPSKNMTVCGDGGMVVTDNEYLASQCKMLRDHGRNYNDSDGKYNIKSLGYNFRMSEISAAIGSEQLKVLPQLIQLRQTIAGIYNKNLTDKIKKPFIHGNRQHVFHQYVIRTNKRDELKQYLYDNGIETGIHYPIPCHEQDLFLDTLPLDVLEITLDNTERICNEILSLPMHPGLGCKEVETVISTVNDFFGE